MSLIVLYFVIGFLFALLLRKKAGTAMPIAVWFWAIVVWPIFIIEMGGDLKL
jgi:hypothetical protein